MNTVEMLRNDVYWGLYDLESKLKRMIEDGRDWMPEEQRSGLAEMIKRLDKLGDFATGLADEIEEVLA